MWFQNLFKKIKFILRKKGSRSKKAFVIVAMGDSTVEGIGASHPKRSFPRLVFSAIKKTFKNTKLYNLGEKRATLADLLGAQLEEAISLKPDLVLISVGGNDLKKKTKIASFESNFAILLKRLKKETGALIAVNNIPDISLAPSIPWMVKLYGKFFLHRLNKKIKELTLKTGGIFIDLYSQSKLYKGYKELISEDGLHPSDTGYALWANTIISRLEDIIVDYRKSKAEINPAF